MMQLVSNIWPNIYSEGRIYNAYNRIVTDRSLPKNFKEGFADSDIGGAGLNEWSWQNLLFMLSNTIKNLEL